MSSEPYAWPDIPRPVGSSIEARVEGSPIEVAGLIRRVRRDADLSQTQLAHRLGVSQSTIARWENGHAEPTLHMFQTILAVAGYTLTVHDTQGAEPQPLRDDAPRDDAGRRLPAHLDLHEGDDPETHEFRLNTPHRPERDRRRARTGRVQALANGEPDPYALPDCACLDACLEAPHCTDNCPCACEPRPPGHWRPQQACADVGEPALAW